MKKLIKDIYEINKELNKAKIDYENIVNRCTLLNRRQSAININKSDLTLTPEMYQELTQIKQELSISHSHIQIYKKEIRKLKEKLESREKSLLSLVKETPPSRVESIEVLMILQSLIKHKEKYRDFSRDLTRVSSMRVISAQIADDIDDVINLCANSSV